MGQKIKRRVGILVVIFLGWLIIRALFIFWLREKEISEIQTDKKILEKIFSDAPKTTAVYWVSAVEPKSIGPSKVEYYIYAELAADEFADFIEGKTYSSVSRLPLFFQPQQITGPFHWYELEEPVTATEEITSFHKTVYLDLEKDLLFIEAFTI